MLICVLVRSRCCGCLPRNAGRLVSKDDIIAKVWDDVAVTEDSLTQCVTDIRKALGDDDRRVLRTVPRKGYLLVPSQRGAQLTSHERGQPSLAIMPFLSIGSEDALGIGMATEIINELARNKDLRLIARDSSFALAGHTLLVEEIGERLGVRYLVEESVQRSDGASGELGASCGATTAGKAPSNAGTTPTPAPIA
jgi:adenylate cyclase